MFDGFVTVDIEPQGHCSHSSLLRCCIQEHPILFIAHAPIASHDVLSLEAGIAQIYLDLHCIMCYAESLANISNGQKRRQPQPSKSGIYGDPIWRRLYPFLQVCRRKTTIKFTGNAQKFQFSVPMALDRRNLDPDSSKITLWYNLLLISITDL